MADTLKIEVKEEQRDRCARITRTRIGQKVISTPNFCVQLQDSDELDLLIELKEQNPSDRLTTSVFRFVDMQHALWRLHPKVPMDVLMQVRKDKYNLFFEHEVLLKDPSLEYLYYLPRMNGFQTNPYTPRIILNYVSEIRKIQHETEYTLGKKKAYKSFEAKRDMKHREFWRNLCDEKNKESNQKRLNLIRSFLQCDLDYETDAVLPPTPLIDSEEMLEIAQKMNDDTKELARGKKHCATFFLFKSSVLSDWSLLDKALRYIVENASESLTAIKFKYLNLTNPNLQRERDNYRDFMSNLEFFTKTFKNRACLVLENNCQSFVSPIAGFDVVSSSFTNSDVEFSFGKHAPYGKWLDPKLLTQRPWKDVQDMYETNGMIPHSCDYCRSVKVKELKQLPPNQWYVIRRGHVASFMDEWIGYIRKAIDDDKNIELIVDRLANSKIGILKDLLPKDLKSRK
jgi:hypothetical protein